MLSGGPFTVSEDVVNIVEGDSYVSPKLSIRFWFGESHSKFH